MRLMQASRTPEFRLLDPPWQALLKVALLELAPPSDGEGTGAPVTRPASRRRRRGAVGMTPIDDLPSVRTVIDASDEQPAFRLAVLLIRKGMEPDEWVPEGDEAIEDLKRSCSDGIHPVWSDLAGATPLLLPMSAFPQEDHVEGAAMALDLSSLRIDPMDLDALALALAAAEPALEDVEARVELRSVLTILHGNRSKRIRNLESQNIPALLRLKGPTSAIAALMAMAAGRLDELEAALARLEPIDADLAFDLGELHRLRRNVPTKWDEALSRTRDDALSLAIVLAAWSMADAPYASLDPYLLDEGRALLISEIGSEAANHLRGPRFTALVRDSRWDDATASLDDLSLADVDDPSALLAFLQHASGDEGAIDWFRSNLAGADAPLVAAVLSTEGAPLDLRSDALGALLEHAPEAWTPFAEEAMVTALRVGDIDALEAIVEHGREGTVNPHLLDLIRVLQPATGAGPASVSGSRTSTAEMVEPPESMAPATSQLVALLVGRPYDHELIGSLFTVGVAQAFNTLRWGLDGGDLRHINPVELNRLSKGVEDSDLSPLDRQLLEAMLDQLRLIRVTGLIHGAGDDAEIDRLVEYVVSDGHVTNSAMTRIRSFVLEHEMGSPAVVAWYQRNAPNSVWRLLAQAAHEAKNGQDLPAARHFVHAAGRGELGYTDRMKALRSALIHFARSGHWSEAVDLLESESALKSTITASFNLYIRVSALASSDQEQANRALLDHIRSEATIEDQDEDGETILRKVDQYSSDLLERLYHYPVDDQRGLPLEPFRGRVLAAQKRLENQRHRRNQRWSFDRQFDVKMRDSLTTVDELYRIAKAAVLERPVEGLMMLERAQRHEGLGFNEKRSLARAQAMLAHDLLDGIAVRDRTGFRQLDLKPLVIVDTNLLVDALVQRAASEVGVASIVALDSGTQNGFHAALKSFSKESRIHLHVPDVVRREVRGFTRSARMEEILLGLPVPQSVIENVQRDLATLMDEVLDDFQTWVPPYPETREHASSRSEEIESFLTSHAEVFAEISKATSHGTRTELNGEQIYPEAGDLGIMNIASRFASEALDDIGMILVASRDNDFTLLNRSFEEVLGFGVVGNGRALQRLAPADIQV